MALRARLWRVGTVLMLLAGLAATFVGSAVVGMRVALRVRDVRVPDVTGRTIQDATGLMAAQGLSLRVDENRRLSGAVPAGRIVQQDPAPGAGARRQRSVRVWLSAGTRATVVPALVGQSERAARLRLDQDGLVLAQVAEVYSTDYGTDAVVAQSPLAQAAGDRVSLLVNRGDRALGFIMPDVIGTEGVRAADVLRARGLRVTIVGQQPYPGVPAGTVVKQQPLAGHQVTPMDAIALEVSR